MVNNLRMKWMIGGKYWNRTNSPYESIPRHEHLSPAKIPDVFGWLWHAPRSRLRFPTGYYSPEYFWPFWWASSILDLELALEYIRVMSVRIFRSQQNIRKPHPLNCGWWWACIELVILRPCERPIHFATAQNDQLSEPTPTARPAVRMRTAAHCFGWTPHIWWILMVNYQKFDVNRGCLLMWIYY